jgi:hypothetical protein
MNDDEPPPVDNKPMPFLLAVVVGVVLICLFSLAAVLLGPPG